MVEASDSAGRATPGGGEPGSEPKGAPPREDAERALADVREILVGPERARLDGLERHAREYRPSAEEVARVLSDAVHVETRRGERLSRALSPTIEGALHDSVRRNPKVLADAVFPIIGPAIRRAIGAALAQMTQGFNRALEESLSPRGLRWRFEAWRTKKPFAEVVLLKSLAYRVEQVFLIRSDSGLLIAHLSAPRIHAQDPDLVAAMLEALQSFVADSFAKGEEATLQELEFGELDFEIVRGPRASLAALVRGEAPEDLRTRLQETLESIHRAFASELGRATNDDGLAAGVQPLLERCLESKQREHRPPSVFRWVASFALLAATFFGVRTWLDHRDGAQLRERVLRAVAHEPGFVLIDCQGDGRHLVLRGLRDPLARDFAALAREGPFDAARVELDLRPFDSLEPALVLARARRRLAPPPGVELELVGTRLVLRGECPAIWAREHLGAAAALSGVESIDRSGLVELHPESAPPTEESPRQN